MSDVEKKYQDQRRAAKDSVQQAIEFACQNEGEPELILAGWAQQMLIGAMRSVVNYTEGAVDAGPLEEKDTKRIKKQLTTLVDSIAEIDKIFPLHGED